MHIFLAALAHETNSFSPIPTTLRSFEEGILVRPGADAAAQALAHGFPGYGFLLEVAREHGDRVTQGLCAWAQPGGPVARQVYEGLRDELLGQLAAAGPVDAVFLVLHGAMIAQGCQDCEGDLLERVRAAVGPGVPVGALLDLHATVTPRMTDSGAVLVACKEYPHTDYLARTRELHAILSGMAGGGCRPDTLLRRVPMLGLFGTGEAPMRALLERVREEEAQDGILSISLIHGFPWSDTAETGAAVLVVFESGARERADTIAAQLAHAFYALRNLGARSMLALDEAVDAALAPSAGLVVMADSSDNPGGGAACDSTFVLRALLERGARDVALGMLWDPLAVQLAMDAGVGAVLPLRIGGKVGPGSGQPVDLLATVTAVRRDARQHGLAGKYTESLGDAVAIRALGIDIVLNTRRQQVFSPECFTELGIDLSTKRLAVVKSTRHFRACFDPIAHETIICDAPGALHSDLARLPYVHLQRPMWPLDEETGHA
ncbi:M81 family metallopeptidase [Massilia agri]|uniref:Microcystinase C n=1 Tax=Massilia agri TaxID=1886785 RepID=A0ABT2AGR3_9BURK|nr:M81 family metallopeptidase [Massilia agri]MCS0595375.1 M81 family metallopeptidase [Massilia agri]